MRGTITIGTKEVEMLANAASPYLFKRIFNQDFLKEAQKEAVDTSIIEKMGFVMAEQAKEGKMSDLLNLNETAFFEWLIQFDPLDVMNASGEIMDLYTRQTGTTSVPKSEGG